jgi:hypothetical protein
MPMLADRLAEQQKGRNKPLWEGPSSNGPNGGITQSMLNNFLVCRERFRIKYVLGLQTPDTFNSRLEYGSMWHCCEEALAAKDEDPWGKVDAYTVELCERYPLQQADIIHWHDICKLQFPIYREYWAKHPDVQNRTPLMQEEVFNIPYRLPSDRTVRLRGKFDSVDLIDGGIWLQENKTKGDIDPQLLQRQLTFDLQTGVYLVALQIYGQRLSYEQVKALDHKTYPIAGVRYNVIRRPLAGGKGSIRQKKNQTQEEYYEELSNLIKGATGPEWGVLPDEHYYFMRWKVAFTAQDIENFRRQFLDPVLEQLCDWWGWIDHATRHETSPFDGHVHFRAPYGIYSPLYDGKPTDVDEYLATGLTVGLHRADSLFRELK